MTVQSRADVLSRSGAGPLRVSSRASPRRSRGRLGEYCRRAFLQPSDQRNHRATYVQAWPRRSLALSRSAKRRDFSLSSMRPAWRTSRPILCGTRSCCRHSMSITVPLNAVGLPLVRHCGTAGGDTPRRAGGGAARTSPTRAGRRGGGGVSDRQRPGARYAKGTCAQARHELPRGMKLTERDDVQTGQVRAAWRSNSPRSTEQQYRWE